MLTVGFIYNLKAKGPAETDAFLEFDEQSTIDSIREALKSRHKVIPIEADSNLSEHLNKHKRELDIVFNIAEGKKGVWREAFVPMILEEMRIPYTGSDPATLMLCLDKQRTKEVLKFHNVKCPSSKVFYEVPELSKAEILPLELPLIIKPLWEGSSKGIKNSSLVIGLNECQREIARVIQAYEQPALVEEFISGREFTVAVLGNDDNITTLPVVEINFSALPKGASPIYSYEAKWLWDLPEKPLDIFYCPADISIELERKIKHTAVQAYKALRCRDWCRIDIRMDKMDNPYVLELNPIPGIIPDPSCNSCFPRAAYVLGWTYQQLVNTVLLTACKRYGIVLPVDINT